MIIKKIKNLFTRFSKYLKHDLWQIKVIDLPKIRGLFITLLRVMLLAIRGYKEDKCQLKASALTFFSLLSIVPVIALIFAIFQGVGMEKMLEDQLVISFKGQEEIIFQIMKFARSMLETTKSKMFPIIGVLMLLWSVMKVLGNIESSFNDIWNIKRARSFVRKFTDYIALMLIAPLFIVLSSSATVFVSAYLGNPSSDSLILEYFGPILTLLIRLLPFLLYSLLLSFLYLIIPNTRVKFGAAFLGGIIAGTGYQLLQIVYINFQVLLSNYNAVYGSFAALPLFIIWLQISWLIILLGAEIAFARQNVNKYEFETEDKSISTSFKRLLCLLITHKIIKRFENGEPPPNAHQISRELEVPIRLVNELLHALNGCKLVSEVRTTDEKVYAYQPARNINSITINSILKGMEEQGADQIRLNDSEEKERLKKILLSFNESIEKSGIDCLLKDV